MGKILKEGRRIALYMGIGDGHINKNSYFLSIRHCLKQKEYLEWKRKLLIEKGFSCSEIKYVPNNGYGAYEFYTHYNKCFKLIRKILYKNRKKYYNPAVFKKITPLGLAIWYMDDGSISTDSQRSILTISTCTTREENQKIIDIIKERFQISFGQRKMGKNYALICGTREARKFLKIVEPYIMQVSCMRYKLNVKPISYKQNNN